MLSVVHCVGGTIIIKKDGNAISWIDIFGDLCLPETLSGSEKEEITSFLDSNHICYNK